MAGILGIDAAWTEKEPSGVAFIEGAQGGWSCVAVAPSYGYVYSACSRKVLPERRDERKIHVVEYSRH